jgi:hypothetical protein
MIVGRVCRGHLTHRPARLPSAVPGGAGAGCAYVLRGGACASTRETAIYGRNFQYRISLSCILLYRIHYRMTGSTGVHYTYRTGSGARVTRYSVSERSPLSVSRPAHARAVGSTLVVSLPRRPRLGWCSRVDGLVQPLQPMPAARGESLIGPIRPKAHPMLHTKTDVPGGKAIEG